jgi:hypothetical protein
MDMNENFTRSAIGVSFAKKILKWLALAIAVSGLTYYLVFSFSMNLLLALELPPTDTLAKTYLSTTKKVSAQSTESPDGVSGICQTMEAEERPRCIEMLNGFKEIGKNEDLKAKLQSAELTQLEALTKYWYYPYPLMMRDQALQQEVETWREANELVHVDLSGVSLEFQSTLKYEFKKELTSQILGLLFLLFFFPLMLSSISVYFSMLMAGVMTKPNWLFKRIKALRERMGERNKNTVGCAFETRKFPSKVYAFLWGIVHPSNSYVFKFAIFFWVGFMVFMVGSFTVIINTMF